MSCLFLVDRTVEDEVTATSIQLGAEEQYSRRLTFVSTNLFMVARISWCPDTSSNVSGLYFSTLQ
jgi:hypothetical protein